MDPEIDRLKKLLENKDKFILILAERLWICSQLLTKCAEKKMKPKVPLKWHGGKVYIASKIVDLFPSHLHYVEPFFGGGAVLLAWTKGNRSELVNDLDGNLINFWRHLQDPSSFALMKRKLDAVSLAREEWIYAYKNRESEACTPLERAILFFIFCRQSLAGRMTSFTPPTRTRLRRGMNGNVSEWLSAVDGLPEVHARLRSVMIENMDALELIPREDTEGSLFYIDPPYLPESRSTPNVYAKEMTKEQHIKLLDIIKQVKGKVLLSGYPSELYSLALKDWNQHAFDLPNNAAGGKSKKRETEVVWCNF